MVIVWDGRHALPAIVTSNSDVPTQTWAPTSGESITVIAPRDAEGKVSIDLALRGDFRIRSSIDDMEDTQ